MGLTDQYLQYKATDTFNIIASVRANINFIPFAGIEGRYALTAAAENSLIWDLRTGKRVLALERANHEVTALRPSPDCVHVAVGYEDGILQIFNITQSQNDQNAVMCTIALHKSAITILRYEENGLRLVSGGLDTDLVVVDIIEQVGKERLIGHNGPITDAYFLEELKFSNIVVSSSKDMQIKFWNLETHACFKTIVDNRTEIWSMAIFEDLLIAGCSENNMNVYSIKDGSELDVANEISINDVDSENILSVSNCGAIQRTGKGRTVNALADASGRFLICHGTDNLVEIFYISTEEERKKSAMKRRKKNKTEHNEINEIDVCLTDKIKRLNTLKISSKIKSIDIIVATGGNELRLLLGTAKNSIELYNIQVIDKKQQNSKLLTTLSRPGHQSELRCVCFTSDSTGMGSGAGDSFKLWNRESKECFHTISANYVLCCVFAPGDREVLLGLKCGKLLIVNVGTGDISEEVEAHEKELWNIVILPDRQGCVTGSSDNSVKHWNFEVIDGLNISLLHKRTLQLDESVLNVCISPDQKYLAVGLLDATVKVFFFDTLKYFLSLYGHNLPVLCADISYDSKLICTGSADRYIKVWGLDFGDCHHSFFAHDDSVMAVCFVPKTHMIFSCGKDGKIKQWDADSFKHIITLSGHIGEAHNLAVSPNGKFLLSCGSDRTLRLYERTEELIVLNDIEETEEVDCQKFGTGETNTTALLPGLNMGSLKTVGSVRAVESLIECLEICVQYDTVEKSGEKLDLHPLMRVAQVDNASDLLLKTIVRIRSYELEESLLMLPFANVVELLTRILKLLTNQKDEIELLMKITIFLLKVHMKIIVGNRTLKPLLEKLLVALKKNTHNLRDFIGYNFHVLSMFQKIAEKEDEKPFQKYKRENKYLKTKYKILT